MDAGNRRAANNNNTAKVSAAVKMLFSTSINTYVANVHAVANTGLETCINRVIANIIISLRKYRNS